MKSRFHFATSDVPTRHQRRLGVSFLELLAVVTIVGLIATVVLVRFLPPAHATKKNACYVCRGEIELQAQLWYRNQGRWPIANLSDLGSDPSYFPDGLPTCPVDGSPYTFDPATQRVIGHVH